MWGNTGFPQLWRHYFFPQFFFKLRRHSLRSSVTSCAVENVRTELAGTGLSSRRPKARWAWFPDWSSQEENSPWSSPVGITTKTTKTIPVAALLLPYFYCHSKNTKEIFEVFLVVGKVERERKIIASVRKLFLLSACRCTRQISSLKNLSRDRRPSLTLPTHRATWTLNDLAVGNNYRIFFSSLVRKKLQTFCTHSYKRKKKNIVSLFK